MGTKLFKHKYEELIAEDLKVLYTLPHSCERMHIEAVLRESIEFSYPSVKKDQTTCLDCGKPHYLNDEDAGSEREIKKLCIKCYLTKYLDELNNFDKNIGDLYFHDKLNDLKNYALEDLKVVNDFDEKIEQLGLDLTGVKTVSKYQDLTFEALDKFIENECSKGNSKLTLSKTGHSMGTKMIAYLVKKGFEVYTDNTLIQISW